MCCRRWRPPSNSPGFFTPRTIHYRTNGIIPTAVRCGKVVRFHHPSAAKAHGLDLPEFGTQPARQTYLN